MKGFCKAFFKLLGGGRCKHKWEPLTCNRWQVISSEVCIACDDYREVIMQPHPPNTFPPCNAWWDHKSIDKVTVLCYPDERIWKWSPLLVMNDKKGITFKSDIQCGPQCNV